MGWVISKPQKFCTILCGMTQLLQVQQASLGLFQKKSKLGAGGDIEFPGVSKKWHMEFKVANENESGISKGDQEIIIWNFQESLFLELEFIRVLTQFCGISRG